LLLRLTIRCDHAHGVVTAQEPEGACLDLPTGVEQRDGVVRDWEGQHVLLLLPLLLPLHSCQLASVNRLLIIQWYIDDIILIISLLQLFLVDLDGPSAIEEVVSLLLLLLALQ
jgi:hypothetical protein